MEENHKILISRRFIEYVDQLIISKKITSAKEFAETIGVPAQSISDIRRTVAGEAKGNKYVTIEMIANTCLAYGVESQYFFGGESVREIVRPIVRPIDVSNSIVHDNEAEYGRKVPQATEHTYTVDAQGLEVIPLLEMKAAAGMGYLNQGHISELDYIQVPLRMLKSGLKRGIRLRGDSMAPTFFDDEHQIVRALDKSDWLYMPDEHCYLIVDMENHAYFKRVKNRWEKGFITLMSDNPDKASYPNINLKEAEVAHVWIWEMGLKFKAPNIHNQYYSRLGKIEDSIEMLTEEMESMKKRLK